MSFWQAPVVVVALLTWLNATPLSFADAAQREALRRQMMPKPTRQLSNLNLPASAIVTEASLAAAAASGSSPARAADDIDTPVPQAATAPAAPAVGAAPAATGGGDKHDEQWWRDRVAAARQALDDHKGLAAALQSQINGLTTDFTSRDDPAQRAKVAQDRQKALDQLGRMQSQIDTDTKAIALIQDDARKQGVPPGWVR